MEYGSIHREIHVDATPEVVYEVVSTPAHVQQWWSDRAEFDPVVGGTGTLRFGDPSSPDAVVEHLTVVEADPPRRFCFRWVHDAGAVATATNSLLVTFELEASGDGTLLRLTETGFRERGWEVAVLEAHYRDHVSGWDHFLPRLATYAAGLVDTP